MIFLTNFLLLNILIERVLYKIRPFLTGVSSRSVASVSGHLLLPDPMIVLDSSELLLLTIVVL